MSRVAEGHFRRKREAPLILRGSTSQLRGHPGPDADHLGPRSARALLLLWFVGACFEASLNYGIVG
jgi:hypothetical protein